MGHDTPQHGDDSSGNGFTFDRRTVLGLLEVGGVGVATGTVRGDRGEEKRPTQKWNQDIDARGHNLFDLRSIEVDYVYTAARKADVIVWKDG